MFAVRPANPKSITISDAAVFALAWFGAKHLDTTVLFAYLVSGGCCFLTALLVSYGVIQEFFLPDEAPPLTGAAADLCKADPECEHYHALNGHMRHPLNALPLLLLNVLWGLGVWTAYKLYKHPTTTADKRVPPQDTSANAAVGGGAAPAAEGATEPFIHKLFVTKIGPDPTANDPATAARAATLQTYIYNICFYCCLFETLRVGWKYSIVSPATAGPDLLTRCV